MRSHRQCGFSLITTLFLLVVISAMAAYMVNLSVTQHTSGALAAQMSRALYATYSGLEWTAYEIRTNPGACPPVPSVFNAEGFLISLTACTRNLITEAGANYALYDVTVEASQGAFGDPSFVSRSLRATLSE